MTYMPPMTGAEVLRVRRMRAAGYTIAETAGAVGRCHETVRKLAPGYTGKVDNAALREAFVRSGVSACEVARQLGWFAVPGKGDSSRVRRTLGITDTTNGAGRHSTRRLIDWETGSLIAEAIGVAPWSVLDDDVSVAA